VPLKPDPAIFTPANVVYVIEAGEKGQISMGVIKIGLEDPPGSDGHVRSFN